MQFGKNLIKALIAALLLAIGSLTVLNNTFDSVQAADKAIVSDTVVKKVMHTAIVYDKDGKKSDAVFYAYKEILVDVKPVTIKNNLYYKIANKNNQYVRTTNVDGVTRKITHNAYIYKTSTKRTTYKNKWKLDKGQTITTYGSAYKFKNGKYYFRVGGPTKQYVKSYNLGSVISTNATTAKKEETTVTVIFSPYTYLYTEVPGKAAVQITNKRVKKGTKLTVDRLEQGSRANTGSDGDDDNELAIYHIKDSKYWIYSNDVQAAKKLPVHYYDKITSSLIRIPNDVELYNANGTSQNIKLAKNSVPWKVDKLIYIWVPSENKAEEFYRLKPTKYWWDVLSLSSNGEYVPDYMPLKDDTYVKASDVQFETQSVALTPSNTPEQAEAAAKK